MEREHGNTEDRFVIAVREHSDTRADEDVDDRPVVGHLPRADLSAVSSMYNVLICSNHTRTSLTWEIYLFSV